MYEVLLKQACVLLALLIALPMGGQAVRENMYTLPEIKEQAQSGWHRSYEAHGYTHHRAGGEAGVGAEDIFSPSRE